PGRRRSLLHRQFAGRSPEIRDVRRILRRCRTWPVAPVGGVTTFPAMSLTTTLSHAHLRNHFHACAFVTSSAEERAVIDPFLVEGMHRGEKAVHRRSRAPRRPPGPPGGRRARAGSAGGDD